MYELQTVASVKQELKVGESVVVTTPGGCFPSDAVKPNDALSTKSNSTGSLTSLGSSISEEGVDKKEKQQRL
jgi:hypothetical protein